MEEEVWLSSHRWGGTKHTFKLSRSERVHILTYIFHSSVSLLDSNEVSAVWRRGSLQCFLLRHCGNCSLLAHLLQG